MAEKHCKPILLGPKITDKRHVNHGDNYKFTIRSYYIASSSHGTNLETHIYCFEGLTADRSNLYAKLVFVPDDRRRPPQLHANGTHYEVLMSATMLTAVLTQLEIPGCMFSFEAPAYAKIDTDPFSDAYCPPLK